ncbi:helix-turn-helix transcriptional regulator [Oceanicola sp. S124]|uniref:helix-turn-helix transcriptional regulator n=1 Tax=Oceanicola sp. S124 TaxID=1042378 RepID=UPI001438C4A8|nr:response regulator transcription factor [Oceanicola sp. S124]
MRTIDREFTSVRAARYPDVTTWGQVALGHRPARVPPTRLLVVDERQTIDLLHFLETRGDDLAATRLAIAVRRHDGAAALLEHWRDPLTSYGISVLPMNLNLTAWIRLLRLIECGEQYLPVSAIGTAFPAPQGPGQGRGAALRSGSGQGCPGAGASETLTPRERQVLRLLADGRPNKVIARELSVSAHTVKLHIHRIMGKLGVSNRTEAAIHFLRDSRATEDITGTGPEG